MIKATHYTEQGHVDIEIRGASFSGEPIMPDDLAHEIRTRYHLPMGISIETKNSIDDLPAEDPNGKGKGKGKKGKPREV